MQHRLLKRPLGTLRPRSSQQSELVDTQRTCRARTFVKENRKGKETNPLPHKEKTKRTHFRTHKMTTKQAANTLCTLAALTNARLSFTATDLSPIQIIVLMEKLNGADGSGNTPFKVSCTPLPKVFYEDVVLTKFEDDDNELGFRVELDLPSYAVLPHKGILMDSPGAFSISGHTPSMVLDVVYTGSWTSSVDVLKAHYNFQRSIVGGLDLLVVTLV